MIDASAFLEVLMRSPSGLAVQALLGDMMAPDLLDAEVFHRLVRTGLDLTVPTFDYRTAAGFWGIDDAPLAVRVHSIVGGTPAYRREYTAGDTPTGAADFDAWVARTVLNPAEQVHCIGVDRLYTVEPAH